MGIPTIPRFFSQKVSGIDLCFNSHSFSSPTLPTPTCRVNPANSCSYLPTSISSSPERGTRRHKIEIWMSNGFLLILPSNLYIRMSNCWRIFDTFKSTSRAVLEFLTSGFQQAPLWMEEGSPNPWIQSSSQMLLKKGIIAASLHPMEMYRKCISHDSQGITHLSKKIPTENKKQLQQTLAS